MLQDLTIVETDQRANIAFSTARPASRLIRSLDFATAADLCGLNRELDAPAVQEWSDRDKDGIGPHTAVRCETQ